MNEVRTRHELAPVAAAEAGAELIAVIVAVTDGEPRVLTIDNGQALPSGPFELTHRSLQSGMRSWVERQTHHPLGYVEQLYTFADRDRTRDRPAHGVDQLSGPDARGACFRRAARGLAELVSLLSLGGPPQRHSTGRGADRRETARVGERCRRSGNPARAPAADRDHVRP